jgi:DNA-binding CsgD family transcriptional regulator
VDQVILILFFVVLIAGIAAITHLCSAGRSVAGFLDYRRHLLFLNVFVFIHLGEYYFKSNLYSYPDGFALFKLIHVIVIGASIVCMFGLTYTLIQVILEFQGKSFHRAVNVFFLIAGAISLLGYGATGTLFFIRNNYQWINILYKTAISAAMLAALAAFVRALIRNRSMEDERRRRLLGWFISFYLSGFVMVLVSLPFGFPADAIVPIIVVFLINLFSIFWVRRWLSIRKSGLMPVALMKDELEKIIRRHGISDREKRILEMILEGKSNHEIKEELFISIHTVKNHVYSIYRKLGIRSRGQLQRLVMNGSLN